MVMGSYRLPVVLTVATFVRSLDDMPDVSRTTRKLSWQPPRRRVSVLAEMALRRERIVERLSELRERDSLTQEQAAHRVGVTTRQWQRWESGESVPYPRNLDQVASAFGISVQEFFDGPPDGSQLDRIEALLEELLSRLPGPAEVLEAEAARLDAQRKHTGARSKRTRTTG